MLDIDDILVADAVESLTLQNYKQSFPFIDNKIKWPWIRHFI